MSRTAFACPDCGTELQVAEAVPGREVQCICGASVEVPYLPRDVAGQRRARARRRSRSPRLLRLAWGASAVLALILIIGGTNLYIRARIRSGREAKVEELLASTLALEKAGKIDRAFVEAEAALALIRSDAGVKGGLGDEVGKVRDRLSIREARGHLDQVDRLDPRRAVGDCLTLLVRSESDSSLASLTPAIVAALDRSRLRQARADLAAASSATDGGRVVEALGLLEAVESLCPKLSPNERDSVSTKMQEAARRLVGGFGVNLPPVRGQFVLGSPEAYAATLGPHLIDALKTRSYLLRPAKSAFGSLWDDVAPYELALDVLESQSGYYLQSKSRTSEIRGSIVLTKGSMILWQTEINARTRVPLDGLPALVASRLAVSDRRLPEAERKLYDDALASFTELIGGRLRGLPRPMAAPAPL